MENTKMKIFMANCIVTVEFWRRLLERLSSRSKARRPEGGDENGLAAALLLRHASIQICSFLN
jgi:hypothetical protein